MLSRLWALNLARSCNSDGVMQFSLAWTPCNMTATGMISNRTAMDISTPVLLNNH